MKGLPQVPVKLPPPIFCSCTSEFLLTTLVLQPPPAFVAVVEEVTEPVLSFSQPDEKMPVLDTTDLGKFNEVPTGMVIMFSIDISVSRLT